MRHPFLRTLAGSGVTTDPNFENVTLLLHGDGTNGGQNNTFVDGSTNNFSITRNGNTTQGTFSPYGDLWSNYFDGTGDYLTVTYTTANFDWWTTGSDFTVEAWVYANSWTNWSVFDSPRLVGNMDPTGGTNGWSFGPDTTGKLRFYYYTGTGRTVISSATLATSQWNHIAMTKTSSGITLFINGTAETTTAIVGTPQSYTAQPLTIGSWYSTSITGYVSNLRIVRGTAVYSGNFTVPTSPLTAVSNTKYLTCQSNRFRDTSSNNLAITRTGDVSVQRFSPFSPTAAYAAGTIGGSGYFDGTGDYLQVADNAALEVGSSDFTVECWAYLNALPASNGASVFAQKGGTSASNFEFNFRIFNNAGTIVLQLASSSDGVNVVNLNSSGVSIVAGTWYHFAVTKSGTDATLWINGASAGTSSSIPSTIYSGAGAFYSGANNANANLLNGYISNLRLVKGTRVYTAAFTPPSAPLTAITNTSLLTCQSNRFRDASSNNFTITRNGDVSVQRFSPFSPTAAYAAGTIGGSGYFDGTGDWVSAADNAAFTLGSGDFTLELWAYFQASGLQLIAGQNSGSASTSSIDIRFNSGTISATAHVGSTGYSASGSGVTSCWNHIAWVRDGTTLRLYVNGTQVGTNTSISTQTINDSSSVFGIGRVAGGFEMTGYLSDVRLLKGTCQYPSGTAFTPPTAPLTAITNTSLLLNFTNAAILDNAMMAVPETVGNAQISTSVKKYGTGSLYFDGTDDGLTSPYNPAYSFGTGDFTIEAWVYIAGNSAVDAGGVRAAAIVGSFPTSGTLTNVWVLAISGNSTTTGTGFFFQHFVSGTSYTVSVTTTLAQTTWHHLAVARSGTTTKLFLNGSEVASGTLGNQNVNGAYPIYVGRNIYTGYPNVLNGYIDDLRITKGVARYTANFTAPTAAFPDL